MWLHMLHFQHLINQIATLLNFFPSDIFRHRLRSWLRPLPPLMICTQLFCPRHPPPPNMRGHLLLRLPAMIYPFSSFYTQTKTEDSGTMPTAMKNPFTSISFVSPVFTFFTDREETVPVPFIFSTTVSHTGSMFGV